MHVSTTDKIAATLGPARGLPTWMQFFRPTATGRIEFSAMLLLSSSTGCWRKRPSRGHSPSVYLIASPSLLAGSVPMATASIAASIWSNSSRDLWFRQLAFACFRRETRL